MDELSQMDVVVLAALSDQPRYGYELVQQVAALTDDRIVIRPGNLYRVLHRLAERRLVIELADYGDGADERRRYFRTTPRGRRLAAEQLAMYARVLQRAPGLREALAHG